MKTASKISIPDESAAEDIASGETEIVQKVLRALAGLEYGSVEIIVHDAKVVQIERTQRSRFSKALEVPRI